MIFEKLEMKIDVEKLRDYVYENVLKLPPVMQCPAFGGWSILSKAGTYTDGWQTGHFAYKEQADGRTAYDNNLAKEMGVVPEQDHCNPTELCTGYVLDLINSIKDMGLEPCRARWSLLRANGQSNLHRDGRAHVYAVRLHIPVFTNEKCTFASEGEEEHLPLGGVYLLRVNRMHQIFNRSNKDRIHILMNVFDRKGLSKHHRMIT